jgi:hypothetical protein
LRSSDAFTVRRCQILLTSARGERAPGIAQHLGGDDQTVRNAIRAFEEQGLDCLTKTSSRAHHIYPAFEGDGCERLRDLLHHSPRLYHKPTSVWTLDVAAEVSFEQGLTATRVTGATIRATLARLKIRWRRAKHWITSPDPEYAKKKRNRDRLIRLAARHPEWALGCADEVWWSRVSQPSAHLWMDPDQPVRLLEPVLPKDDPDPKALACYGLLVRWVAPAGVRQERLWLRFVDGRPISAVTTQFLGWCCERLAAQGKRALLLVWDNASWHVSQEARTWIRAHNRQVKQTGQGVRILACFLPSKSPWLNPIEAKWRHGKRRVIEAERVLAPTELAERVCDAFACPYEPHLAIPEKAA